MAKVLKFTKRNMQRIYDAIEKPIEDAKPYFDGLAAFILRQALLTFSRDGARDGHRKWRTFATKTLHPSWTRKNGTTVVNATKWNRRPGTDDSRTRRYSANSKMMRASGEFRKTFEIMRTTNNMAKVGTTHILAKKIMRAPISKFHRPVLFVLQSDEIKYKKMFIKFYNKGFNKAL